MSKRAEMRRLEKENLKKTKKYILTQEQISRLKEDTIVDFVEKAKNLNGFYVLTQEQICEMERNIYQEAVDTSFGLMLAIPSNILAEDYWQKTADKRLPQFLEKCLHKYESIGNGSITISELIKNTEKLGKLKMHCVEKLRRLRKDI